VLKGSHRFPRSAGTWRCTQPCQRSSPYVGKGVATCRRFRVKAHVFSSFGCRRNDEQFTVLRQWVNSPFSQVILRTSGKAYPVNSAAEFGAKFSTVRSRQSTMPSSKVVAQGRYLDSNQWMQHTEVSVQSVNHTRLSNAEF
jgi:hypothetical protein